jgi:DNA-binding LytR/AlgR family response regulator
MPGMDGFEVLKALRAPRPHVVFATAYDEYAIRAFEVGAVDYLLKPFARARVGEAVSRARARLGSEQGNGPDWDALLRRLEERRTVHVSQVPVHSGKRILIVPVADVLWFGVSTGSSTRIRTSAPT